MAAPFGHKVTPFDPDDWEPVIAGPTWTVDESGESYVMPEHTLGWELAEFAARWLKIDDEVTGDFRPFTFSDEQLRFGLWFYAHDENGKFLYRRALLQRLKGWGKDPFAAALALFEGVGNCRLKYIDEDGNSVGRPCRNPYIQIAAVTMEQTRNTSDMFKALLTDEAIDHFNFNLGMEVQYARGGLVEIHCVTSNPRALEGKRPSFLIANETQHWMENNQGHKMYGVMKGNLIKHKDQCHMLVIANAPIPGEDSVSERLITAYDDTIIGKAKDYDLLYDSLEAPANAPADDEEVIADIIRVVRGDSVWLPIEDVVSDFFDSLIPKSESRRKWYNQVVADSDTLLSRELIMSTRREGQLSPGDEIVLGFDGGRTDDATALVAIRIKDRLAIPIRIWEKPRDADTWMVPHEQVDSAVHDTFKRYTVKAFFADVNQWETFIMGWSADYGEQLMVRASGQSVIGWDMRGVKMATLAHERFLNSIFSGRLFHNGDPHLMQHMGNATVRDNAFGRSFGKPGGRGSSRKVDGYAALMIAHEALNQYLERASHKENQRERTGRVHFY